MDAGSMHFRYGASVHCDWLGRGHVSPMPPHCEKSGTLVLLALSPNATGCGGVLSFCLGPGSRPNFEGVGEMAGLLIVAPIGVPAAAACEAVMGPGRNNPAVLASAWSASRAACRSFLPLPASLLGGSDGGVFLLGLSLGAGAGAGWPSMPETVLPLSGRHSHMNLLSRTHTDLLAAQSRYCASAQRL
jgi:hypothetical protein